VGISNALIILGMLLVQDIPHDRSWLRMSYHWMISS
jgi:hypothetical protein